MTDYKEYAKQMRENAVKNEQGNIVCSPELWEEIASVIERAIVPPCKVGGAIFLVSDGRVDSGLVKSINVFVRTMQINGMYWNEDKQEWLSFTSPLCCFGKTVFLTKEEAEQALAERNDNNDKNT